MVLYANELKLNCEFQCSGMLSMNFKASLSLVKSAFLFNNWRQKYLTNDLDLILQDLLMLTLLLDMFYIYDYIID